MSIKDGVRFTSVDQAMAFADRVVSAAYARRGVVDVITSANDGRHGVGSLHFIGAAYDYRTKTVPRSEINGLVEEIREHLGEQYDVLFEYEGRPNEHLHVEFQPHTGG